MSRWRVRDEGAVQLMTRDYKNLLSGMCRSEALRPVQLERIGSGDAEAIHPSAWAVFVLTGGGRPVSVQ